MSPVQSLIPSIVSGLIDRHGLEWASYPRDPESVNLEVASASCQWQGPDGYFVVLRPADGSAYRLVSARVLPTNPVPKQWTAIRDERTTSDPVQIGFATHRYLYVPDRALERAQATFEGSDVLVVAFSATGAMPPTP